jgi:hypothetical protein
VGGLDAEGDDASLRGRRRRGPAGLAEGLGLAHDVVGGQHQRQGVGAALESEHGSDCDRRAGVAPHRLEHDVGLDAALAQLLGHHEAEIGAGDDDRAGEQRGVGNPRQHLLKGRLRPDQGDELLGHALARHRPQPGAGAAAHDHRNDGSCHAEFLVNPTVQAGAAENVKRPARPQRGPVLSPR